MSVSLVDGHIDEPRLTDEQIIKALECCTNPSVGEKCPKAKYNIDGFCNEGCMNSLMCDVLDLINRKNRAIEYLQLCYEKSEETCSKIMEHNAELLTEIERLQKENERFADIGKMYSEIRAEVRKEFAEMLREKAVCIPENEEYLDLDVVFVEDIDNLLKEMDGESE